MHDDISGSGFFNLGGDGFLHIHLFFYEHIKNRSILLVVILYSDLSIKMCLFLTNLSMYVLIFFSI